MKNIKWLGYSIIISAVFWVALIYTVGSFKTPVSDLNISDIHSVEEPSCIPCDCSEQEKLNILLLERCKGK